MKRWKRPGRVYAVNVIHPDRGVLVRYGYIGKTRQLVINRLRQHAVCQPWWDTHVGYETLWESQSCTALRLWWEEVWRIVVLFPLYNIQWNKLNPRRIKPWTAALRGRGVAYQAGVRELARQGIRTGWLS